MDFANELVTACLIAREGGALILSYHRAFHPLYHGDAGGPPDNRTPPGPAMAVQLKAGDEPVTEADQAVNALCVSRLRAAFPGDALLTEELPDDGSRFGAARAWLLDPIDGTKDFIAGRPGFCLMIGLLLDGEPALGVVYQPLGDVLYLAAAGQGAFRVEQGKRERLKVSSVADLGSARMVSSASHPAKLVQRMRAEAGIRDEMNIGSIGLKLSLIAAGERDLYVNPSGQTKLWDTCAPEVILREAGGCLTDTSGAKLSYRDGLNHSRGLLATNGPLHEPALLRLRSLLQAGGQASGATS